MALVERGLGVLIESFSEFLQRLFFGNGNTEPSDKELEKSLHIQGNLALKEALELPFSKLLPKLQNIKTKDIDRLVVYLYDKLIGYEKKEPERLEKTLIQLINYLDNERDEFSLERNNIKNSLLH